MAGILVGIAAIAQPFARHAMPISPQINAILVTATIVMSAVTAFLIFAQYFVARQLPLALLGTAFLYTSAIGIPYLAGFTDVLAQRGMPNSQAATYLWLFWHAGFVLLVLAYIVTSARAVPTLSDEATRDGALWCIFGVFVTVPILTFVSAARNFLPSLGNHGSYALIGTYGLAPILVGLCASILVAALAITRGRTILNLWLCVALFATLLDVLLATFGERSYSVGWYISRVHNLLSSAIVLGVFLHELTAFSAHHARLAAFDALTGLPNRRTLDQRLESLMGDKRRRTDAFSVLMIDIDHFKMFNDKYGHATGDEGLRAVAAAIRRCLSRAPDLAARYGGEEFCVVLPDTDRRGALAMGEKIRTAVEKVTVPHSTGPIRVTVSIGCVSVNAGKRICRDATDILMIADRALYTAKATGRNRVVEAQQLTVVQGGNGAATA